MARSPRKSRPGNKRKPVGRKRPFTPDQVQLITCTTIADEERRDRALFSTAIDMMLRRSVLVALRVQDVCDAGCMDAEAFTVRQ